MEFRALSTAWFLTPIQLFMRRSQPREIVLLLRIMKGLSKTRSASPQHKK